MNYSIFPQSNQNPRRCAWMEYTSLTFGILSLVNICIIYPALIFGALAIVFGLLSRGGEMLLSSRSKTAITLGSVSIAIVIFMVICSLAMLIIYYGSIFNIPLDASGRPIIDYDGMLQFYMDQTAL